MMIIVGPQSSGKTELILGELIRVFKERGYTLLVCASRKFADEMSTLIFERKIDVPRPISFQEFVRGDYYAPNVRAFLFDNLDQCVQNMTQVPILAVSLTLAPGQDVIHAKRD